MNDGRRECLSDYLTDRQVTWLQKHYKHTKNSDICKKYDWSEHRLRYVAKKYNLRKTRNFKRKIAQDALQKRITDEQREWLRQNFGNTKNEDVARHLGLSMTSMHRFAREMRLTKTREFIKECQANTTEAARVAHIISGWPPKGYKIPRSKEFCFKKGESNRTRLGEERFRECIRKSTESLRKRRESEKRRVAWGLPQLTKLRVTPEDPKKRNERWYLKKRGYMIDEEEHVAYHDALTSIAIIKENNGAMYYDIADISELDEAYRKEFREERNRHLGIEVIYLQEEDNDINIKAMKRKKRIYLSGPITGVENAKEIFSREAAILEGRGFSVVTPYMNGLDEAAPYEEHMTADIELLKTCDVICMLPGWEKSRGALREKAVAEEMKMNIITLRR